MNIYTNNINRACKFTRNSTFCETDVCRYVHRQSKFVNTPLKATSTSKLAAVLKSYSKIFLISKSSTLSSYSCESSSSLLTEDKFGSGLLGYGFFSRKTALLFVLFNKTGNFGFTTFALSLCDGPCCAA